MLLQRICLINCVYLCNENQLDALFVLSLFCHQPPHVSGIFVAHHQEVYCIYTTVGTCCALQLTVCCPSSVPTRTTDSQLQSATHSNCCIYTVYLLMIGYEYA